MKHGVQKFILQLLSFGIISSNRGIAERLGHLLELFVFRADHFLLSFLFLQVIDILFHFLLGFRLFCCRGAFLGLHLISTLLWLVPSALHLRCGSLFLLFIRHFDFIVFLLRLLMLLIMLLLFLV